MAKTKKKVINIFDDLGSSLLTRRHTSAVKRSICV